MAVNQELHQWPTWFRTEKGPTSQKIEDKKNKNKQQPCKKVCSLFQLPHAINTRFEKGEKRDSHYHPVDVHLRSCGGGKEGGSGISSFL